MAGLELHSRPVHPALRPYVADVTGYAYPGEPPALHRGLPSQYLTLVITLDEPLGLAWPGSPVGKFDTVVGGLHSTAVHIGQSPNRSGIQLALRPAAARALLGLPPGELASMVVELDDILGQPGPRCQRAIAGGDDLGRALRPGREPAARALGGRARAGGPGRARLGLAATPRDGRRGRRRGPGDRGRVEPAAPDGSVHR